MTTLTRCLRLGVPVLSVALALVACADQTVSAGTSNGGVGSLTDGTNTDDVATDGGENQIGDGGALLDGFSPTNTGAADITKTPADVHKTDTDTANTGKIDASKTDIGKPPPDANITDVPIADTKPVPLVVGTVRHFGANLNEEAPGMTRLSNGDILLAGYTSSTGAGNWDGLAVRIAACGKLVQARTYGTKSKERFHGAAGTKDGGAWLVGSSVVGTNSEALVVRTNNTLGVMSSGLHGGSNFDEALDVAALAQGGAAVVAKTYSLGPGAPKTHNMLVMGFTKAGKLSWGKAYGGDKNGDAGFAIVGLDAGGMTTGLAIAGATETWGAGDDDVWLMRLDINGKHLWSRAYGTLGDDEGRGLVALADGGFFVTGFTDGAGAAKDDGFALRVDKSGATKWIARIGGAGDERGYAVAQTAAGLFVAGRSNGLGGGDDGFLTKLNSNGGSVWTRRVGGSAMREVNTIIPMADGSVAMAGYSNDTGQGMREATYARTSASAGLGCAGKSIPTSQLGVKKISMTNTPFTPVIVGAVKSQPVTLTSNVAAIIKASLVCNAGSCP